jgi:putative iron-dependent peroxidase
MENVQAGILAPVPRLARYLTFSLKAGPFNGRSLQALTDLVDGNRTVTGVGYPLVLALGCTIPGLRIFPSHFGSGWTFK